MSAFIPIDILIEILCLLPVKTLLRFTSVCKTWYSLILNPSFISKHLNQSIINPGGDIKNELSLVWLREIYVGTKFCALDCIYNRNRTEFECPITGVKDCIQVLGICNGLVLLSSSFAWADTMTIWNPSARRSVRLPRPFFSSLIRVNRFFGFGFDSMNNDYKVVLILYNFIQGDPYSNNSPKVEIYTLSTGVWRNISDIAPSYSNSIFHGSTAWLNGHVHWICTKKRENGSLHYLISGFNMNAEVFKEVMMPEVLVETGVNHVAVKSWDKSLALVEYKNGYQTRLDECCWIWKMNEYNVVESWCRVFKIDMSLSFMIVESLQRSNDVILNCSKRGLISYHPNTQKIQALGIPAKYQSYVYSFVESLVLMEENQNFTL